jgi:hypothetical protein
MQLADIPTQSIRIKDILANETNLQDVQTYCGLVDASEREKTIFRGGFTDEQYKELKLDAKVIKKHVQAIDNSGASWLKYDKDNGFYLLEYI